MTRGRLRRLRRIGAVAVALLVALAVAGGVAVSRIDLAQFRDTVTHRVETALGRRLSVDGEMSLAFGLSPTVHLADLRLADAPWAGSGPMAEIAAVEADLALLPLLVGDIVLERVILERPVLRLARDGDRRNWRFAGREQRVRPATEGRPVLPRVENLVIRDGRVTLHQADKAGGRGTIRVLDLDRLHAERRSDGQIHLTAQAQVQGIPVELSGLVGYPETALTPSSRFPIDLALAAPEGALRLSGTVMDPSGQPQLDIALNLESQAPRALAERFGLSAGAVPPVPLTGEGQVAGTWPHFALRDLRLDQGESRVEGRLHLDLSGSRPHVKGQLRARQLDLAARADAHKAPPTPADPANASAPGARVFPATPLPLDRLRGLDLTLNLRAGMLRLPPDLTLTDARAGIVLDHGRLRIAPLATTLAGGRLDGELALDAQAKPARLDLKLDGAGIGYGKLLAAGGVSDGVTGRTALSLDLAARGNTPRALAETAQGEVGLTAGAGRIDHGLLRAAGSGLGDLLAPWRRNGGDVALTCAVARFDLADGVATVRHLLADTEAATLAGEGRIDLAQERYDLRLVPHAKRTSLMSLAVPVRVTGPLRTPALGPDALGAAKAGAITLGTLLNPLATVAALVVDSETGDGNPCVAALNANTRRPGAAANPTEGDGFFENLGRRFNESLELDEGDDPELQPLLQDRQPRQGR